MASPTDQHPQGVGQLPAEGTYAAGRKRATSVQPDLILVHPLLDAAHVRQLLPAFWPEGEMAKLPEGYHEVASPLFGLRAFCRHEPGCIFGSPAQDLTQRVRTWVDDLSLRWQFAEVFRAGDLNFWAFLRDRLILWLRELMLQRRAFDELLEQREVLILAAGLSEDQRLLLRELSKQHGPRLRTVLAYADPPAPPAPETVAERRARKVFFLLQDAWHGVQFLWEDLFVRRPKLLLVSHSSCWRRRRGADGRTARTDVHLEAVWREGRKSRLRLYLRADSYHPDVGAMTAGRLAPSHLRHFLFLLAQTSRGFRETRSILRKWLRLKQKPGFEDSLQLEGLALSGLLVRWLDTATRELLPEYVRDIRRESHFLRGIRPDAIVLTHEQAENRPLLAAARRLSIPTVALQTQPLQQWDDAYMSSPPDPSHSVCLPDRLCVFTSETKQRLVERGAFNPAQVVVTGDPRQQAAPAGQGIDPAERARLRRQWGVEADQDVIALACASQELAEILGWLSASISGNRQIFLLIRLQAQVQGEEATARQIAGAHGLRWVHFIKQSALGERLPAVDLLLTSNPHEMAEALLQEIPVVRVQRSSGLSSWPIEMPSNVPLAKSAEELGEVIAALQRKALSDLMPSGPVNTFLDASFGDRPGNASREVVELVQSMLSGAGAD